MSVQLHQQAYTYVLNAEKFNSPKLFIEKAKLHWLRTEHEEALITLKRGLNQYIPDGCSSQESQQIIANLSDDQKYTNFCLSLYWTLLILSTENCAPKQGFW